MKIIVIKQNKLYQTILPNKVNGSIYLYDYKDGNKKRLLSVEAKDNNWYLKSNINVYVMIKNQIVDNVLLEDYHFYDVEIKGEESIKIYCEPTVSNVVYLYEIPNTLLIGNSLDNNIIINENTNLKCSVRITNQNNQFYLEDLNTSLGVYVNNQRITKTWLRTNDKIFIAGYHFTIVNNKIIISGNKYKTNLKQINIPIQQIVDKENQPLLTYQKQDYFSIAPRFRSSIEKEKVIIDPPPEKQEGQNMPLIYTMGPMITMGMTSVVMGFVAINGVMNKQQTLENAMPSIVICLAMLMTMILWPLLTKNYQKKQIILREEKRQKKYSDYLNEKKRTLELINHKQQQILIENYLSLDECYGTVYRKDRNLFSRNINHDDFLVVRLGLGDVNVQVDLTCPAEHFYLEEDNLKTQIESIVYETELIKNVPVTTSLLEKNFSAVVGEYNLIQPFTDGIITQLITLHNYLDLKIVILTNKENEEKWKVYSKIPHIFNEDKTIRFMATNEDETLEVTRYLEQELYQRTTEESKDFHNFKPYYVIITDNYKNINNNSFLLKILKQPVNLGFSLLILSDRLTSLPNVCNNFISIGKNESGVFENELVSDKQKRFKAEYPNIYHIQNICQILADIPLEETKKLKHLPETLDFLDMYGVGKIEDLNILNNWKKSDPTISLASPIGVDEHGEIFKLDLHEKYHGPHGLIAGMTGSGKSEFIITFILSLAINYHPYEVSFVLIDYKGGGLAGAFLNKETGISLPHLAGVITNLDNASMNRALASIQSELRRRQKLFNEARDLLNEGTIDIYKYQGLYRNHLVKEPVSHLFIISDEFAELKAQRPEFMDELISTARIGRSLGVHLILATQKPSGIVNDQIWSNSRFRVCLKVQEKEDSIDVIKCPDAAYLNKTGRFYLQVGYNELFLLGQSAYTGLTYVPQTELKEKMNMSIEIISNTGIKIKQIDDEISIKPGIGKVLIYLVKYLHDIASKESIKVPKLWLDPIPPIITIDYLKNKYQYKEEKYNLNPIIGEYDVPASQQQNLLTLPLSKEGNTIIYGAPSSGKEQLLNALIYSLITNHTSKEVELYLLDFGSEMLRMFNLAPQVGDVVTLSENDKITNLFKYLKEEIEKRKQILIDFNGSFDYYLKNCSDPLPYKVVIINNYDAFKETYEDLDEDLNLVTREGFKYGIIFVLTTSSSNGIRFKTKQNFKQELVLQFNSVDDYSFILGNTKGMEPSPFPGRGLIKLGEIYEFQTASILDNNTIMPYIKDLTMKLKENMDKAFKIPILPDIVTPNLFDNISLDNIPIGIEKDSLKDISISLKQKYTLQVTGYDTSLFSNFIDGLLDCLVKIKESKIIVLDLEELINKRNDLLYFDNNIDDFINKLKQKISLELSYYQQNNYQKQSLDKMDKWLVVIIGLEKLKSRYGDIGSTLEQGKDLGTVKFILVDTIDNFSKMEFESWYKTIVSNNNGIWLGNGIADQYTLKLSKTPKSLYDDVGTSFGYVIKRGVPILTKVISKEEESE